MIWGKKGRKMVQWRDDERTEGEKSRWKIRRR
jgi:hypothetical protein